MDFIFMLTRDDRTVEDALDVVEAIRPLGLRHIGFKDVGAGPDVLQELTRRIREQGAISYLEVVGTTPEACLRSVRAAREIGVDRLLGGTDADAALRILEGSGIDYYPFPGFPSGHPTALGGAPEDVAAHCEAFMAKGCPGVDLLAYRAKDAEPLDLVRAARRALGSGMLIVAGSVDQPTRIRALREAGADAFTIGSAVFNGAFSPRKGALLSQLRDVLAACR
jgi:methylmalonyl-CoA mutase cobalamin-binding subunit